MHLPAPSKPRSSAPPVSYDAERSSLPAEPSPELITAVLALGAQPKGRVATCSCGAIFRKEDAGVRGYLAYTTQRSARYHLEQDRNQSEKPSRQKGSQKFRWQTSRRRPTFRHAEHFQDEQSCDGRRVESCEVWREATLAPFRGREAVPSPDHPVIPTRHRCGHVASPATASIRTAQSTGIESSKRQNWDVKHADTAIPASPPVAPFMQHFVSGASSPSPAAQLRQQVLLRASRSDSGSNSSSLRAYAPRASSPRRVRFAQVSAEFRQLPPADSQKADHSREGSLKATLLQRLPRSSRWLLGADQLASRMRKLETTGMASAASDEGTSTRQRRKTNAYSWRNPCLLPSCPPDCTCL